LLVGGWQVLEIFSYRVEVMFYRIEGGRQMVEGKTRRAQGIRQSIFGFLNLKD
jgi:hypothetical protein